MRTIEYMNCWQTRFILNDSFGIAGNHFLGITSDWRKTRCSEV